MGYTESVTDPVHRLCFYLCVLVCSLLSRTHVVGVGVGGPKSPLTHLVQIRLQGWIQHFFLSLPFILLVGQFFINVSNFSGNAI